jgi:hypothetical protein
MMNGALPVVVAVVTAIWIRTMPSDGSSADVKGIARPIQAIYTPGTLMLHVEIVAFVMSAPYGVWGFSHSTFSLASFSALAVLAVLGTGFAFVLFAA